MPGEGLSTSTRVAVQLAIEQNGGEELEGKDPFDVNRYRQQPRVRDGIILLLKGALLHLRGGCDTIQASVKSGY